MGTLCNKENTEFALVHSIRVCGPLPSCFDTLLCAKLASVGLEDEPTGQKSCISPYFSERKWKAYGTRCSQAVPHPSTILARRCLTSVIGRERVFSSWYGRRHQDVSFFPFYKKFIIYLTQRSIILSVTCISDRILCRGHCSIIPQALYMFTALPGFKSRAFTDWRML